MVKICETPTLYFSFLFLFKHYAFNYILPSFKFDIVMQWPKYSGKHFGPGTANLHTFFFSSPHTLTTTSSVPTFKQASYKIFSKTSDDPVYAFLLRHFSQACHIHRRFTHGHSILTFSVPKYSKCSSEYFLSPNNVTA